jgi:phosphopantetheinyl transferase
VPIFFQQQINETTRLGVWKIEETEDFFKGNVPHHRDVTHPHKRLQHLAGRFLLQYLFPDFPYNLIQIADTRKPFLPNEQYHFSISHCGDYAAAIVSRKHRVGIDVEIPTAKILNIASKFLSEKEKQEFAISMKTVNFQLVTKLWSAKEAVFTN